MCDILHGIFCVDITFKLRTNRTLHHFTMKKCGLNWQIAVNCQQDFKHFFYARFLRCSNLRQPLAFDNNARSRHAGLVNLEKEAETFDGLWKERTWPTLKTKILTYQSKASLDVKILFGKIAHLFDLENRKALLRGWYENHSHIRFWSMIYLRLN